MDVLKDFSLVLQETLKKYKKKVHLIPKIFLGFLLVHGVYVFLDFFLGSLGASLGSGGFLVGFISVILKAGYHSALLYFLYQSVEYGRVSLHYKEIKASFSYFLWDVYFISFVKFVASLLAGGIYAMPLVQWIVVILFSALPEVIYLGTSHREGLFMENFEFLKNNGALWIPMILIWKFIELSLLRAYIYMGVFAFLTVNGIFGVVVYALLASAFYLYRGVVFKYLNQSNARKRKFMSNF